MSLTPFKYLLAFIPLSQRHILDSHHSGWGFKADCELKILDASQCWDGMLMVSAVKDRGIISFTNLDWQVVEGDDLIIDEGFRWRHIGIPMEFRLLWEINSPMGGWFLSWAVRSRVDRNGYFTFYSLLKIQWNQDLLGLFTISIYKSLYLLLLSDRLPVDSIF